MTCFDLVELPASHPGLRDAYVGPTLAMLLELVPVRACGRVKTCTCAWLHCTQVPCAAECEQLHAWPRCLASAVWNACGTGCSCCLLDDPKRLTQRCIPCVSQDGTVSSLIQQQLVSPHSRVYSMEQAFVMARDIAGAMAHLHKLSPPVVHRDLKLENCLVNRGPKQLTVKTADYGLHVVRGDARRATSCRLGLNDSAWQFSQLTALHACSAWSWPARTAAAAPPPHQHARRHRCPTPPHLPAALRPSGCPAATSAPPPLQSRG